jgi:hypothetical protein
MPLSNASKYCAQLDRVRTAWVCRSEAGVRQDLALQLNAFPEAECWRTFAIAQRYARCLDSPEAATSVCRSPGHAISLFRKMRHFISENQTSCYPL